jgi:hypothetical protein
MEKLKETRGRKAKHLFPDFEVGETYQFKATDPADLNKYGNASYAYASKVCARVMHYSRSNGLGWKIARRTFGTVVEITILP